MKLHLTSLRHAIQTSVLTGALAVATLLPTSATVNAGNFAIPALTGCGSDTITSNFNGTRINGNNYLWFNSVFKASGIGSSPVTIRFANQMIQFSANSTNYALSVPDAQITFNDASVSNPQTTFNAGANQWETRLPGGPLSGNTFLSGLAWQVPASGLPGGIKNVSWSGTFFSGGSSLSKINWQWSAANYTQFSANYNDLGVKAADGYGGSNHAGTPTNFKQFVTGGARGGGGSNFTGSWSGTGSVSCFAPPPAPKVSICGSVYNDLDVDGQIDSGEPKLADVDVTLLDANGNVISDIQTDKDGNYCFTNLDPGIYRVTEQNLPNFVSTNAIPGPDAVKDNDDQITVNATNSGATYQPNDFLDRELKCRPGELC